MLDAGVLAAACASPLTPALQRFPDNGIGEGISAYAVPYLASFPYLGIPHAGNR